MARGSLRVVLVGALVLALSSACRAQPSPTTSDTSSTTPPRTTVQELVPGFLEAQPTFTQARTTNQPAGQPIEVDTTQLGAAQFAATDIGLSFEATDLANDQWDPANGTLDELLTQLGHPGLRFGGNSIDRRTCWTSSGEQPPEWAEVTLTPEDFQRLARMVAVTDSPVTLGLDLGHDDPQRAADMAFHAHQALGDHLIVVTIGNEPNGFYNTRQELRIRDANWNEATYVSRAQAYAQAIHARVPDLSIVGPGAFDAPWWRAFLEAGIPNTVALTQHWYPLWSCDGVKEPRAQPTAGNLVSPWIHERANFILGMGEQTASTADVPLWLEETGRTSCPGANSAANTHAQALWTVDYTLTAVQHGIQRINHHSMLGSCAGGAPMSIVCTNQSSHQLNGRASYLGLALLAQIPAGSSGGRVPASGPTTAYSFRHDRDLYVAVINPTDPTSIGRSPISVTVPEGATLREVSQLSGSDLADPTTSQFIPLSPSPALPAELNPASATLFHYVLTSSPTSSRNS